MRNSSIVEELSRRTTHWGNESGRSQRSFYIHMRTRDSVLVKEGQTVDWSDEDVLTILLDEKGDEIVRSTYEKGDGLFEALGKIAIGAVLAKHESDRAARRRIPWDEIESLGPPI